MSLGVCGVESAMVFKSNLQMHAAEATFVVQMLMILCSVGIQGTVFV